jgi:glycosyltransferase involved in cell wall biosynthesis
MDLELLLITFNRAEALDRTLAQLHASPFAGLPLTVLDNASTDATPEVCAAWQSRFADMRVVRHRLNVGGGPNYLRAVELASRGYTWVLADDDDFDFSACDDVIAAVRDGVADIVCVGGTGREDWPAGLTSMRRLWGSGRRLLHVMTFIPGVIFRTSLFTDADSSDGYRFVEILYPQFPFLRRQLERDATVYVSERMIVLREGETAPGSFLYWFVRWVRCARSLPTRADTQQAIWQSQPSRSAWLATLAMGIAHERVFHPERVAAEVRELARLLRGSQRLALLALSPIAFGPRRLYAAGMRALRRRRGVDVDEEAFHAIEARP